MTKKIAALTLIVTTFSWAKESTNPADFPLKAHLISTETTRSHGGGTTSSYDYKTGQWSNGTVNQDSLSRRSEFQIDNVIYISPSRCRDTIAGTDYPARLEKDRLFVLAKDKVCKMRISGTREAGK